MAVEPRELRSSTLSAPEVAKRAGISYRRVDYWSRVLGIEAGLGCGSHRRFTRREGVAIAAAAACGATDGAMHGPTYVDQLVRLLEGAFRLTRYACRLEEGGWWLTDDEQVIVSLTRGGLAVSVLCLGPIAEAFGEAP